MGLDLRTDFDELESHVTLVEFPGSRSDFISVVKNCFNGFLHGQALPAAVANVAQGERVGGVVVIGAGGGQEGERARLRGAYHDQAQDITVVVWQCVSDAHRVGVRKEEERAAQVLDSCHGEFGFPVKGSSYGRFRNFPRGSVLWQVSANSPRGGYVREVLATVPRDRVMLPGTWP